MLLDEDGTIKLGGFGLSRHLHHVNAAPVSKRPPVQWCMLSMRQDALLHAAAAVPLACSCHSEEVPKCTTHQNSIISDRHCAHLMNPVPLPLQQATAGSPHYMAPELFRPGAVYSFASDLWALGVVLHECFAGAQPFRRELFADLQRDIEGTAAPPLKGGCGAAAASALQPWQCSVLHAIAARPAPG